MINCVFIMVCVVLITDIFQFWDNFSPIISRWLTHGRIDRPIPSKIMTCSVCQSWWLNLAYIIAFGHFSILNVMIILLLSFSTSVVSDILLSLDGITHKAVDKINEWLKI